MTILLPRLFAWQGTVASNPRHPHWSFEGRSPSWLSVIYRQLTKAPTVVQWVTGT